MKVPRFRFGRLAVPPRFVFPVSARADDGPELPVWRTCGRWRRATILRPRSTRPAARRDAQKARPTKSGDCGQTSGI